MLADRILLVGLAAIAVVTSGVVGARVMQDGPEVASIALPESDELAPPTETEVQYQGELGLELDWNDVAGFCSLKKTRCGASPVWIVAKLRTVPPRTNRIAISDWQRAYEETYAGPIRTWTTMKNVNLPSLDRRSLAMVRPMFPEALDDSRGRWIVIVARNVIDGDAEAALQEVRESPDVERAYIPRIVEHHRLDEPRLR